MNIGKLRICGIIYLIVLIIAGIVGLNTVSRNGFDLGTSTVIEAGIEKDYIGNLSDIEKMVSDTIHSKDVLVQILSSNRLAIRTKELNNDEKIAVINKLDEQFLVPMRTASEQAKAEEEALKAAEEEMQEMVQTLDDTVPTDVATDTVETTDATEVAEPIDEKTGLPESIASKIATIRTVGPNQNFIRIVKCSLLIALVAVVIILVYMWFRFEVLTSKAVVYTGIIEVLLSACFAFLSVMFSNVGYGINVFAIGILGVMYGLSSLFIVLDTLKTNCLSVTKKTSWEDLVNSAVKEIMPRSIAFIITFVVFAGIIAWAGWFYHITVICDFVLPLVLNFVLIEIGTITVAFPLLYGWSNKKEVEKVKAVKK